MKIHHNEQNVVKEQRPSEIKCLTIFHKLWTSQYKKYIGSCYCHSRPDIRHKWPISHPLICKLKRQTIILSDFNRAFMHNQAIESKPVQGNQQIIYAMPINHK